MAEVPVVKPLPETNARSWLGHDLPAILIPYGIPMFDRLHPLLATKSEKPRFNVIDPMFEIADPFPFFALYHIQWPYLLLKQLIFKRKKWMRINTSTARIFECP